MRIWTEYVIPVGLVVISLVLILRPTRARIAGAVLMHALAAAYVALNLEWWEHRCFDVGEPRGCASIEAPLTVIAWLAIAVVLAAGLVGVWLALRHLASRESSRPRLGPR
jgi:hypothetical protein